MLQLHDEPKGSKEKLLCATIELMMSRGYEGTGIHDILDKAQVTKSNFYYHFKSKEALCLEALERMIEAKINLLNHGLFQDQSLTPAQRFERFVQDRVKHFQEGGCRQGCPFVNLAAETSDFHPAFREKLDAYFADYMMIMAKWYQEGVSVGEFRQDLSADKVAQMVNSLVFGSMIAAKTHRSEQFILDNVSLVLTLLKA